MGKKLHIIACLIMVGCSVTAQSQELKEFAKPERRPCDNSFYSSFGATTSDGVIVVYSALKGLEFEILQWKGFLKDTKHDEENNRYVLIVKPTGGEYLYYTISVRVPGYKPVQFSTDEISAGGMPSCCWVVNPLQEVRIKPMSYVLPGMCQVYKCKGYKGLGIPFILGEAASLGIAGLSHYMVKSIDNDLNKPEIVWDENYQNAIDSQNKWKEVRSYSLMAAGVIYAIDVLVACVIPAKSKNIVFAPRTMSLNGETAFVASLSINF